MPSPRHDAINTLFRDRPESAVEILREVMGVDVPVNTSVRLESNDFNDRPSKDFQPDAVIRVGSPQAPEHGIVVEVQQEKSDAKRRQLPRYAAALWLMLRCPVTVLCVCTDDRVAGWYAEAVATELPGYLFRAVVLGPSDVPVIADPEEAAARPELAVLAVMAHGRDRKVVETFVAAMDFVKPDYALQYYEYAFAMAAPAVRSVLEEIMASTAWPVYSPFAREHFGRGKDEGRAEGRAEGRVEGRVQGEADAVLKVLAARGVEVSDEARARILECADEGQLDLWLTRAVIADSVGELFD